MTAARGPSRGLLLVHGLAGAAGILAGLLHNLSILWKMRQETLPDLSAQPPWLLVAVGLGLMVCGALILLSLPRLRSGSLGAPLAAALLLLLAVLGISLAFSEVRGLPLAAFPLLDVVGLVVWRARRD